MVADVSSVEHQPSVWVSSFCSFQRNFTVLHHLVLTIYPTYYAYRLGGDRLLYHLLERKYSSETYTICLLLFLRYIINFIIFFPKTCDIGIKEVNNFISLACLVHLKVFIIVIPILKETLVKTTI